MAQEVAPISFVQEAIDCNMASQYCRYGSHSIRKRRQSTNSIFLWKVSDPKFTPVRSTQKVSSVERNSQHHIDWGARSQGDGFKWAEWPLCEVPAWASEVQKQGDWPYVFMFLLVFVKQLVVSWQLHSGSCFFKC